MIIERSKQQNLVPVLAVVIMMIVLYLTPVAISGIDHIGEAGVSGGHANHEDAISTVLPGNTCPNGCSWPDCGCGDGIVLTLQPTVFITSIPTFNPLITPDIPDPVNNATVFPTLSIDLIPTGIPTALPTADIWPTEIAPPIPTIEPSVRDVDRTDGTGGGLD